MISDSEKLRLCSTVLVRDVQPWAAF